MNPLVRAILCGSAPDCELQVPDGAAYHAVMWSSGDGVCVAAIAGPVRLDGREVHGVRPFSRGASLALGDQPVTPVHFEEASRAACDGWLVEAPGGRAMLIRRADGICAVRLDGSVALDAPGRFVRGVVAVAPERTLLLGDQRRPVAGILRRGPQLEVSGVTRRADQRDLLHEVRFRVAPGQLVAVMGASGSGKSTLLRCLAGDLRPHQGTVLLDGDDLHGASARWRGRIGYVPQDELVHGELTVEEALRFALQIRAGRMPEPEIEVRVQRALEAVDLTAERRQRVGSAREPILSGGQRKRLSVAQELLAEPPLLLLDEPTSGLSSGDAATLVGHLRTLADTGRTVVATIHQPDGELLDRFDQLLVLREGRVAWFGPPAEAYAAFEVARGATGLLLERAVPRPGGDPAPSGARAWTTPSPRPTAPRPAFHAQLLAVLRRAALVKVRDRANLALMVAQAPVVGLLTAALFWQVEPLRRNVPLFVLVVATVFLGCFNAARDVVGERALLRRELAVGLSLGAYLLARFALLCGIGAAQVALLVGLSYGAVGFEGPPLVVLGVLFATIAAASALGLLVSSLARSQEAALAVVPVLLIPQMLLAGVLIGIDKGPIVEGLAAAMPSRWAVEALYDVERRALEVWDVPRGGARCDPGTDQGCAPDEVCQASRCERCEPLRHVLPVLTDGIGWRRRHMVCRGLEPGRAPFDVMLLVVMGAVFMGGAAGRLAKETRPG